MVTFEKIKLERYIGKKIHIINMEGEPQYSGKEGIVNFVDDMGQLHGTWGGCAIIPESDTFNIIEDKIS